MIPNRYRVLFSDGITTDEFIYSARDAMEAAIIRRASGLNDDDIIDFPEVIEVKGVESVSEIVKAVDFISKKIGLPGSATDK